LLLSDHIITQVDDWNNYKPFLELPTTLLMRSMDASGKAEPSREKEEKSVCILHGKSRFNREVGGLGVGGKPPKA
jgi:hypothetical protein